MSGQDDHDVEHLTLPEPAASLFRRTREALEAHVGRHTPNGEGIRLTGGTVLAGAVGGTAAATTSTSPTIRKTETAHFDATLRPALEAVGGRSLAWGEWSRVEFGDNHIDLLKAEPQPAIGQGRALIDGSPVTVLTSTQIINAKLHNRSLDPPVRDVYDIAVCGIEDPGGLERSANGVYAATMDATILVWKMHQAEHADRAREELHEVPERLEPVRRRPGAVRDPRSGAGAVQTGDDHLRPRNRTGADDERMGETGDRLRDRGTVGRRVGGERDEPVPAGARTQRHTNAGTSGPGNDRRGTDGHPRRRAVVAPAATRRTGCGGAAGRSGWFRRWVGSRRGVRAARL